MRQMLCFCGVLLTAVTIVFFTSRASAEAVTLPDPVLDDAPGAKGSLMDRTRRALAAVRRLFLETVRGKPR